MIINNIGPFKYIRGYSRYIEYQKCPNRFYKSLRHYLYVNSMKRFPNIWKGKAGNKNNTFFQIYDNPDFVKKERNRIDYKSHSILYKILSIFTYVEEYNKKAFKKLSKEDAAKAIHEYIITVVGRDIFEKYHSDSPKLGYQNCPIPAGLTYQVVANATGKSFWFEGYWQQFKVVRPICKNKF